MRTKTKTEENLNPEMKSLRLDFETDAELRVGTFGIVKIPSQFPRSWENSSSEDRSLYFNFLMHCFRLKYYSHSYNVQYAVHSELRWLLRTFDAASKLEIRGLKNLFFPRNTVYRTRTFLNLCKKFEKQIIECSCCVVIRQTPKKPRMSIYSSTGNLCK